MTLYNVPKAWDNMTTRMANAMRAGGSKWDIANAAVARNRTGMGDYLMHQIAPRALAADSTPTESLNGPVETMADKPQWAIMGYPDQATYDLVRSTGFNGTFAEWQAANAPDSDGETESQSSPYQAVFNGQIYSDPIAYTNAVTESATAEFNRQNKLLTDAYNQGLLDFATYQDQLTKSREGIKTQFQEAMSNISGRFSAMSPDAYQSEQGRKEGAAQDIATENYANVAGAEANMNLQKNLYEQDYLNKQAENQQAMQGQIDSTVNNAYNQLADTTYANNLNQINTPKLNLASPADSGLLSSYSNISQLAKTGNMGAVRSTIANLNVEPNIKDWLYTRFSSQKS